MIEPPPRATRCGHAALRGVEHQVQLVADREVPVLVGHRRDRGEASAPRRCCRGCRSRRGAPLPPRPSDARPRSRRGRAAPSPSSSRPRRDHLDRLGGLRHLEVAADDRSRPRSRKQRGGAALAARRSRDQRDLACEAVSHRLSPLPPRGGGARSTHPRKPDARDAGPAPARRARAKCIAARRRRSAPSRAPGSPVSREAQPETRDRVRERAVGVGPRPRAHLEVSEHVRDLGAVERAAAALRDRGAGGDRRLAAEVVVVGRRSARGVQARPRPVLPDEHAVAVRRRARAAACSSSPAGKSARNSPACSPYSACASATKRAASAM